MLILKAFLKYWKRFELISNIYVSFIEQKEAYYIKYFKILNGYLIIKKFMIITTVGWMSKIK